jgi:transcriptional regulator with XRE-family HTH domain
MESHANKAVATQTIAMRLKTAIRDWPLRALKGWSVNDSIEALPALAHVHVDTISRILDGRTRNPQRGKLRAIAAQLGVTESWLRHGQEELALVGNRSLSRPTKRSETRPQDTPPERSLLATVLQEVNRFPDPVARVRVFRAAVDAMIKAAVDDGEVLSTGYGALSELDTWMATERWRAKAAVVNDG